MDTVLIQDQTIHLRNAVYELLQKELITEGVACPMFQTQSKNFFSERAVLTEGDGANEKDKFLVGR